LGQFTITNSDIALVQAGSIASCRLNPEEISLFMKVNEERVKSGLPQLYLEPGLVNLARIKSNEMFAQNYFSHISPVYGTPFDMLKNNGITARVMGAENIAKAQNVLRVHDLFMSSREHRNNILNPLHDTIGIGVLKNSFGVYATQLFTGH
jgi:uncharacterized protein YkwD